MPGVSPILGESEAGITALSADQTPPVVVPVPSEGQAGVEAGGAPAEVTNQLATEAIPLLTSERKELPLALVAPTMVGATPPVKALSSQAEGI